MDIFKDKNKVAAQSWEQSSNQLDAELVIGISIKPNGQSYIYYDDGRKKENIIEILKQSINGLENALIQEGLTN